MIFLGVREKSSTWMEYGEWDKFNLLTLFIFISIFM